MGFAEFGDPHGLAIFYCHGFPASRLEGKLFDIAARQNNIRLIVMDRPGYGLSGPKRLAKIAHWTHDLIELANHLEIDRFGVLGVSGGGPYALACAYQFPSRLSAIGVVCGLGPVYSNWALKRMKWPARIGFFLAKSAPVLLPVLYGNMTAKLMHWRPQMCQSLLTIAAPQSDRTVLRKPEVAENISGSIKAALHQGAKGALADFYRYVNDWGFKPENIEIPINLWHGTVDTVVPACHTEYFANIIPKTRCEYLPGEGHFSLPILHIDEIFKRLTTNR